MQSIRESVEKADFSREWAHLVTPPSRLSQCVNRVFQWFCNIMLTIYCPLEVSGKENLPEAPFIFCSNHNSHMDCTVLMASSGLPFKKFGMVAASDYFFENGFRRRFLGSLMNLIPIDRKPKYQSIVELVGACREFTNLGARNLIIFPEGTRSKTGRIQRFKKGAALISTELGIPIVPVYIHGTYEAFPKGQVFAKPGKVQAFIGKPIYPPRIALERANGRQNGVYRSLTKILEERIQELNRTNHVTK